jgi:hypothetical protein
MPQFALMPTLSLLEPYNMCRTRPRLCRLPFQNLPHVRHVDYSRRRVWPLVIACGELVAGDHGRERAREVFASGR